MMRRTSRLAVVLVAVMMTAHAVTARACEYLCASSGVLAHADASAHEAAAADCHSGTSEEGGVRIARPNGQGPHAQADLPGVAERVPPVKPPIVVTSGSDSNRSRTVTGRFASSIPVTTAPPGIGLDAIVPLRR